MSLSTTATPGSPTEQLLLAAEALVKERMAAYDPSHDWLHVNRVRRTALALAKAEAEPVDMLIVELAALFHDLTDAKYATGEPLSTVDLLRPFFNSAIALAVIPAPFSHDELDPASVVCRIVDATSWSKERKLRAKGEWENGWREVCRELAVVQDADRLDAIGGFGIMRCCAYSASVNRPLHLPKGDPRHAETAIAHFDDKLFKIDERAMKTPLGKKLASRRQAAMRAFVDSVEEEYALLNEI